MQTAVLINRLTACQATDCQPAAQAANPLFPRNRCGACRPMSQLRQPSTAQVIALVDDDRNILTSVSIGAAGRRLCHAGLFRWRDRAQGAARKSARSGGLRHQDAADGRARTAATAARKIGAAGDLPDQQGRGARRGARAWRWARTIISPSRSASGCWSPGSARSCAAPNWSAAAAEADPPMPMPPSRSGAGG